MGGDDSQKLLPWRGIHSSPGRKPPAQLRINNVTETAGWNLALPPPSLAGLAVASATGRLGHFWKAHSGQFWRAPKRQWVMHTSTIFSPGGNLLEQRHRNPDGSHWSMECRYDDGGRLSQKDEANIQGTPLWLYYHYDSFGRLERVVARSATGTDRVYELYQYDETGRKTVTVYPDPALRGKLHTTVETASETSADASSIVTHFDHQDRPCKRLFY